MAFSTPGGRPPSPECAPSRVQTRTSDVRGCSMGGKFPIHGRDGAVGVEVSPRNDRLLEVHGERIQPLLPELFTGACQSLPDVIREVVPVALREPFALQKIFLPAVVILNVVTKL